MLWTASGYADGFSDVLHQWKKSELESYLPRGDTDSLIIFPIRNAVPGENKPWDQVTGHERTAPRRRANGATISQPVQHHTPAPMTHAAEPSTRYGWGPMNALFDPNLAASSERPQSLATNPMNSNIHFNPNLGLAFQPAGNMWNPFLDSLWVLPQQSSTTIPPRLRVGVTQPPFNYVPFDFVPTSTNWVPWESTEPLGSGIQISTIDSGSQGYHVGGDVVLADFGIDPSQAASNEDPSTFSPNQQDFHPNSEFHNDLQGAETWIMTTSRPAINTSSFSTTDTGNSSMLDMSSDFERQLTTVQVLPSIQSSGRNGSVTSTRIPNGSLWQDSGTGVERSDIGEYGLGAGEESQEKGCFLDLK
jgi:hypothetical protein